MSWKEDPRWAYVFVNLSCLMWASNFVLGRTLREEIGPLMLTVSRFVVASLFYAVILGRSAVKERLLSLTFCIGVFNSRRQQMPY
jgi:drug/metabolite transporter (DMT)-like permease